MMLAAKILIGNDNRCCNQDNTQRRSFGVKEVAQCPLLRQKGLVMPATCGVAVMVSPCLDCIHCYANSSENCCIGFVLISAAL